MSRFCRHCGVKLTTEYGYAINYDEWKTGFCETCCNTLEQEALNRFNLPSWRDAFAILLLVALVFATLILLGSSKGWS